MRNLYQFIALFLLLGASWQLAAQTRVMVPLSSDPSNPTDLFPIIMGDTTATGQRNDNNTTYVLENGGLYIITGRIVNTPEWPLQIEAADLTDTENKPIITRRPNEAGEWQDIARPAGDVSWRNVWVIVGERDGGQQHDWGRIRYNGEGSRLIIQDCIFEKDRGGFVQVRADNMKIYIENTVFRNGGNRQVLQGNGRGVDARDRVIDTLVMRNCIVYNIQDRIFRSQGGGDPHNYIEIDNCTSFNTVGRHGHIQLGRVRTAKITNNLFANPIMLGSSDPAYTDEQTQPDDMLHKVITLDTLYDDTQLDIRANNIFWTQDVTDYWASNDSVSAPGVLSDLVMQNLGSAAGDAFFSEVLTLESVPGTILQYVVDLYNDPAALDMFDFIVEDVLVAGTDFDSGNLFDFDTFSACYDPSSVSATAATDGGPIGAVNDCPDLVSALFTPATNRALGLQVAPNPVARQAYLDFELSRAGQVDLVVYDLTGRQVDVIHSGQMLAGEQLLSWDAKAAGLSAGMYIVQLRTAEGMMSTKVLVQ